MLPQKIVTFSKSICCLSLIFLFASPAYGDNVIYAEGIVYSDTLTFTTDPGVNINWTSKSSIADSYVWNNKYAGFEDRQTTTVNGWSSTAALASVSYGSSQGEAIAMAETNDNFLRGFGYAQCKENTLGWYATYGSGVWDSTFTITGSGNITVTVNYSLISYFDVDRPVDISMSFPIVRMQIRYSEYIDPVYDEVALGNSVPRGFSGSSYKSESGTLKLTHWFDDGQAGEFFVYGDGNAQLAVPEPATMLLLGSGLIGLWGFRRKFKK